MAIEQYSNHDLAMYMHGVVVRLAADLDWEVDPNNDTDTGDYADAIEDTLGELEIADSAEARNTFLLKLTARVHLWERVMGGYVGAYSVGTAGKALERQQMFEHARTLYEQALAKQERYLRRLQLLDLGYDNGLVPSGVTYIRTVWGVDDYLRDDD